MDKTLGSSVWVSHSHPPPPEPSSRSRSLGVAPGGLRAVYVTSRYWSSSAWKSACKGEANGAGAAAAATAAAFALAASTATEGLVDSARHVKGCQLTQESRVKNEFADVVSTRTIHQPRHRMPSNSRNEGSRCVR